MNSASTFILVETYSGQAKEFEEFGGSNPTLVVRAIRKISMKASAKLWDVTIEDIPRVVAGFQTFRSRILTFSYTQVGVSHPDHNPNPRHSVP